MLEIFQPSRDTIDSWKTRLPRLLLSSPKIDRVVLAGGFGDSPALKEHLSIAPGRINGLRGANMKLIFTPANTSAASVATGAVIRSQNREKGPKRTPCQSVGIIRHVPRDEELYEPEVLAQRGWEANELDQQYHLIMHQFYCLIVPNRDALHAGLSSPNPRLYLGEIHNGLNTGRCLSAAFHRVERLRRRRVTRFGLFWRKDL